MLAVVWFVVCRSFCVVCCVLLWCAAWCELVVVVSCELIVWCWWLRVARWCLCVFVCVCVCLCMSVCIYVCLAVWLAGCSCVWRAGRRVACVLFGVVLFVVRCVSSGVRRVLLAVCCLLCVVLCCVCCVLFVRVG